MKEHNFVICTKNENYEVSLELRKLYEVVSDSSAKEHGQIRVIDESGEDYLYPSSYFVPLNLTPHVLDRILHAA